MSRLRRRSGFRPQQGHREAQPGDRPDQPDVDASAGSAVEDYLDHLLVAAPGPPRQVRALLAEVEAHLRDATAEGLAHGLSLAQAESQAVARFGSVRLVATAEARRQQVPLSALIRQIVASGVLLGAVAGIAIGISGIVTAIMGALGGSTFIVNISPATHLAPSDCARWLSQNPAAHSCYQAALSDWAAEVVGFRLVAGVAGLFALAAYFFLRRRWSRARLFGTLPPAVVDTVAATLFALSGAWTLGLGIDSLVIGTNGAGQWLGAAPVALALAGYYGLRLVGDLRQVPALSA